MPNDSLPCRGECVEASGSDDGRCGCRFGLNLGSGFQDLECDRLLGHTGNHVACMYEEDRYGLIEWGADGLVKMDDEWWMLSVCDQSPGCEECVLNAWPRELFCIKTILVGNSLPASAVLVLGENYLAIAREKLAEVKEELGIQIAKGFKPCSEKLPDMWGNY